MANSSPSNQDIEMKKKLKTLTLLVGIIVAVVALSNTSTYAENVESTETTELKTLEAEMIEVIGSILEDNETEKAEAKRVRFYNDKNQLVYECRDENDKRLKILLRRSDLVLQTDSSSYYLLGD